GVELTRQLAVRSRICSIWSGVNQVAAVGCSAANWFALTVKSTANGPPPKLQRDDLELFQPDKHIPIECFSLEPASVGIMADTSGSMESKLRQTKAAITEFVNDLNPRDDIFLFAFSSSPFLL